MENEDEIKKVEDLIHKLVKIAPIDFIVEKMIDDIGILDRATRSVKALSDEFITRLDDIQPKAAQVDMEALRNVTARLHEMRDRLTSVSLNFSTLADIIRKAKDEN